MNENIEKEQHFEKDLNQQGDIKSDESQQQTAEKSVINENEAPESTENLTQNYDKQISELNDKYLRLYSEFENYRKRSLKEKSDIIKSAGEDILKAMLPVLDDFERAIKQNEKTDDITVIKDGFNLIHNKFKQTTQQKGLQEYTCVGLPFDSDVMEAITQIPASDPSQKNTVIDEIEKCYKLGDKVIRFAKVVIAQ
ncbi:MAG: nucleotide exchange factor GrpE [Bacteroidetes bacterium]|nr:nucleotide exchange factor GrpE [Bacteroidota bacterium]